MVNTGNPSGKNCTPMIEWNHKNYESVVIRACG